MDAKEDAEQQNVEMLEEVEVNATAGKDEAEKNVAAEAPPGIVEDFDAFDPKLMEEILKYNQKREEIKVKTEKELEAKKKKMQPPPQKSWQAPSMFYKDDDLPSWKKPQEVDMKAMDALFQLAHSLPKIELHAHIGGCFRPQTFLELVEEKKIDIDHIDFYHVDYKQAFEIFKVGSQLVTNCETLARVTLEIIEDYAKQSCRYLELRSTPKVIGEIGSFELYVETVLKALLEGEQRQKNITCAYLVSVNRTAPVEVARKTVDTMLGLKEKWGGEDATEEERAMLKKMVGIELGGDPCSGDFGEELQAEFRRAQENGFKVSLHCAELKQQTDGQKMIDFGPDRLGHCIFLSPEQIKQVVDLGIPVELCPTSNVAGAQCAIVELLPHLKEFSKYEDANIIVCCDDTLLFNTNLSMELFEYAKAVKMTESAQLKKHLIRNIDAIFM